MNNKTNDTLLFLLGLSAILLVISGIATIWIDSDIARKTTLTLILLTTFFWSIAKIKN